MKEKIEEPDWSKCPNWAQYAVFNQAGEGYWGYSYDVYYDDDGSSYEMEDWKPFENTLKRDKDVVLDRLQYKGSRDTYKRHDTLLRNNPPRRKRWWE